MSTEVQERPPAELEPAGEEQHPVRDRLLVPLLLPIGAAVAVLFYVLNLSRLFLAAKDSAAVVVAAVVTVSILAGAALISARPRLRTSSLVLVLAGVGSLVLAAGAVSLGESEPEGEGAAGYVEPEGEPIFTLTVDALPSLAFQADSFTVPAGIIQIDYVNKGGTHTLAFDPPGPTEFLLGPVNAVGETDSGKVELAVGDYVIWCTVPGHRAAGMWADLVVEEGAAPADGGGTEGGTEGTGEAPSTGGTEGGTADAESTTTVAP
ncbi:MAG: sulfocyanin-like copper-binding protein [Acidimicrobiia bacterium]|nr:sulfocyanin-like copper-binding protein [Acidimicrobiia bacterium]